MAQAAMVAGAVGGAASGLAALGQARAERTRANINAYIGDTRAIQTGGAMFSDLASQLATMRATMAGNQQGGGFDLTQQLVEAAGSDRRIAVANERSRAEDWRMEGQAARARGLAGFLGGLGRAGTSLFNLYEFRSAGG